MLEGHNICVVIPAKNEERFIKKVIETLPNFVDLIIVIDDQSSDGTRIEAENANSKHQKNSGRRSRKRRWLRYRHGL